MPLPKQETKHTIVITSSDVMSESVDAFINRQKSLKGEKGVQKGKRKWFRQAWLFYMLCGMLGAFVAWAIIEPNFDDLHYIQGEIQRYDFTYNSQTGTNTSGEFVEVDTFGWVEINNQKIWLWSGLKDLHGNNNSFGLEDFYEGREIGFYTEAFGIGNEIVPFALVVALDPPARKTTVSEPIDLEALMIKNSTMGLLIFPLVSAFVGLFIGAADGISCRLLRRAVLGGLVGLLVGFVGGFISGLMAELIYSPINQIALNNQGDTVSGLSTLGFLVQTGGRGLAWAVCGIAMGLGQGIALRSKRLLLYGIMGGVTGGMFGGILFDPIDLLLFAGNPVSTHLSRMIGFVVIGGFVGASIGLVELISRDIWLLMQKGPLAGKEFLMFRDTMKIGSSPRSEIFLFNDPLVEEHHATLRMVGEHCELESHAHNTPLLVNEMNHKRGRLRHGDRITIGKTVFLFQSKQG